MSGYGGAKAMIFAISQARDTCASARARAVLTTTLAHLDAAENRDTATRVATLDPDFRYVFWSGGESSGVSGLEALSRFYDDLWASEMQVVDFRLDRLVFDERSVVVVGHERVAYPGHIARTRGATEAADGEMWSTGFQSCVIWMFDGPTDKMTSASVFASPEFGTPLPWSRL